MLGRKLLLDKILRVIESNGIVGLKQYLQENDVSQIKKLKYSCKDNDNCDILIKTIESDASCDIIEYIIINGKYKTLNYVYQEGPRSKALTPLTLAFSINRMDIVNLLVKYGGDINQCIGLLSSDAVDQLLNERHNYYLLTKRMIKLTPLFINSLVKSENRINFLRQVFEYVIFDNDFILKLLSYSKNRTKLSKEELCHIIKVEMDKIPINKRLYDIALENQNLDALNLIYQQDTRRKDVKLSEIWDIINYGSLDVKLFFINQFKSKQLAIPMDESFILKLENIVVNSQKGEKIMTLKEKINKIIQIIKSRSRVELETFIVKEKDTIEFNKSIYEVAIENENDHTHEMINILYQNDCRSNDVILKDLFQVFDRYERQHPIGKKINFINDIEHGKMVIQADGYYLNNLLKSEEKRKTILEYIIKDDRIELKKYIEKEKIILDYFNDKYFDLLIFAIENDAMLPMINFLISHYPSLNYYIYDETMEKYKSPLSCAILNYKFSIAQLLLDFGADINYDIHGQDLLSKTYQEGNLTMSILSFILNHKFICISKPVSSFISRRQNIYLKEIFNYYFYDSVFISRLLSLYKHQQPLSIEQWNCLLLKEKTKIKMKFDWYNQALCFDNQEALSILLYYGGMNSIADMSDYEVCNLLDEAMEHSNFEFIESLISYTALNFNSGLELFFSSRFLSKKKLKYRLKNIMFIVEKFLHTNTSLDYHCIDFVKVVLNLSQVLSDLNETEMKYLEMLDLFLKLSFNHPTFDLKLIRSEKISHVLLDDPATRNYPVLKCFIENLFECQQFHLNDFHHQHHLNIFSQNKTNNNGEDSYTNDSYTWSLTSLLIKKVLKHSSFDFRVFSFEKVLSMVIQYDRGTDLIEEIIEKSMSHKTFSSDVVDIKKVLMILRQMDDPEFLLRLFIQKLISYPSFNLDSINMGDILLPCWAIACEEFIKFIIDSIIDHETFIFTHKISEILIVANRMNENSNTSSLSSSSSYLMEKAFHHNTVVLNNKTIESILLTLCKINDDYLLDFVLKHIFNTTTTNKISILDYKKIILFLNRHDNRYMIEWFITTLINENKNSIEFLMKLYETMLLSASNYNNYYSITLIIQKLFKLSSLDSEINSIDLSLIQDINPTFLVLLLNSLIKIRHLSLIQKLFEKLKLQDIVNLTDGNGEYPIIVAASNVLSFSGDINAKSLSIFDYLLKEGVDVRVKNQQGIPLIMLVIRQRNYIALQRILSQQHLSWEWMSDSVKETNDHPLIQGIIQNNLDIVHSVLNSKNVKGIECFQSDKLSNCHHFTPLILSYLLSRKEIFNDIVCAVDINEYDDFGYNILHYAIIKEDISMIHYLLDHGINIHAKKSNWSVSLMDIVLSVKNKEIISILLDHDITLFDDLNCHGEIPLISLLKMNCFSVEEKLDWLKFLLDRGYVLSDTNHSFRNKVYEKIMVSNALKYGEIEIIDFLVHYNLDYFTNNIDLWKEIVWSNRMDVVKLFIPKYLDIFKVNDNSSHLWLNVFENRNKEMVQYLLKNGLSMNVLDSFSIIKNYIKKGKMDFEIIQYILSCSINASTNDEQFQKSCQELLKEVVEFGNLSLVQYLLNHHDDFGLDIHSSTFTIETINKIIHRFENSLFQLLVPKYVDIHQKDNKGRNIFLMEAIQTRNQKLLEYLIEDQNLSVDPCSLENEQKLWEDLIRDNDIDLVKFLIDHEKTYNNDKVDKEQHHDYSYHYDILEKAVDIGKMELIQYLVSQDDVHLNHSFSRGNTPLIYAIQQSSYSETNIAIIKYIIEHRGNVNETNFQGDTPLITAIHSQRKDIVSYLIAHQANIEKKNSYGNTPLITAILENQDDIVELLLRNGADVNAKSKDQNSPLYYAMTTFILQENKNEHLGIIRSLIKYGANLHEKDQNGDLPLVLAIKKGNQQLIKALIDGGALSMETFKGSKPTQNLTCLQAIASGDMDQIKQMNYADVDIIIAFLFAIEMGQLEAMIYFIEHRGASVNEREQWNRSTPIQVAIKSNHLAVVNELMERGAKVNWQLHFAIKRDHRDLILCLLEHGVNVNFQPNRCSPNPLIKACKRSNVHVVRDLVDHGADIHQLYFHLNRFDGDRTEMMPLLIAMINRKISIAKYLIDSGAQVNRGRGYYDKEPLKYAIDSGNLELVQWLVNYGAKVNASSVQKAIELGDLPMIDYLLDSVEKWEDSFYDINKRYHYSSFLNNKYIEERGEEELNLYYQIKELLDKKKRNKK